MYEMESQINLLNVDKGNSGLETLLIFPMCFCVNMPVSATVWDRPYGKLNYWHTVLCFYFQSLAEAYYILLVVCMCIVGS